MKRYLIGLISSFSMIYSALFSVDMDNTCRFDIGYRQDDLQWKVHFLPEDNIVDYQKWHDLKIIQLTGTVESLICDQFYLRGVGDYGWILEGTKSFKEKDLDLFDVSSHQLKAHTRGSVYDFSGAIGYQFNFFEDQIQLRSLAGYSYHVQRFRDKHYHDMTFLVNFFEDVKSTYKYQWEGPWAGVYLSYLWDCQWQIFTEYQFHWNHFKGDINDCLVPGSSKEAGRAHGVLGQEITLGFRHHISCDFEVGILGNYKYWVCNKGTIHSKGQAFNMKNLSWQSLSALLDISYYF